MAAFGFDGYSGVLARQIADSLDKKQNPPLTVGIYGAWGSGKSMLLSETAKKLKDISRVNEKRLIPVMFNAWRFEKEEHLIVPLLKTLYYEIKKIVDAEKQEDKIKKAVNLGQDILRTLLASLEIEASFGFFKAKLKGDKVVENAEKLANYDEYAEKMEKYESKYFDIHGELARFAEKIAVVFLIDDLDRCLPENVLKTLESIKLFLDVEGFAFVLAVDDDVVERGIIHRYKEYADDGRAIITGAEYLEKIVSLPFKLPKILPKDSKKFLMEHYSELFTVSSETKTLKLEVKYDEKLLDLFTRAVPPVPRRLIRAVELFWLKKRLCEESSIELLAKLPHLLARFVILELFAPDIFRFGSEKYKQFNFFDALSQWKSEYKSLGETDKIKEALLKKQALNREDTQNRLKLLSLVEKCNDGRNGFQLDTLFTYSDNSFTHIALIQYITLNIPSRDSNQSSSFANITSNDILNNNAEIRKSILNSANGYLSRASIEKIIENAKGKQVIKTIDWWSDIYKITNEEGWIMLVNNLGILERLIDAK